MSTLTFSTSIVTVYNPVLQRANNLSDRLSQINHPHPRAAVEGG
jgi:hypothetical protein